MHLNRRFHRLTVANIRRETEDAVSLALAVPEGLADAFRFQAGQHLTLRLTLGGEQVRRSYSICSAPADGALRIAVKQVAGGRVSTHINRDLKPGDAIEVTPPDGRFVLPEPLPRRIAAFACGSGITPVLSIVTTALAAGAQVTLAYGNRTVSSVMFREALADLKNRYMARFSLIHVLSRERQDVELLNGRLDAAKVRALVGRLFDPAAIDLALLCGPADMIDQAGAALAELGVAPDRIRSERFLAPDQPAPAQVPAPAAAVRRGDARVAVIRDGIRSQIRVPYGERILDAALRQNLELPFSCRAGVCSTCRCLKRAGEVELAANYSLEPWELAQGFVLACQSRPLSDEVVLDFDEA